MADRNDVVGYCILIAVLIIYIKLRADGVEVWP